MTSLEAARLALALAAPLLALPAVGCGGEDGGDGDTGVVLTLQATGLPPEGRIRVDLELRDSFGDLVDAAIVDAPADRGGAVRDSARLRCRPDTTRPTLSARVTRVDDGDGKPLSASAWYDPTADAPLRLDVSCPVSGDDQVALTLVLARPASAGFFDRAVGFDGVACAASLRCADMPSAALASLADVLGDGDPGAVVELACAGLNDTLPGTLYFDDVRLTCGADDTAPASVVTGADGLLAPGDGLRDAEGLLLAASVRREALTSLGIARWWLTIGLDPRTIAADCTLHAHATAAAAPRVGVATPADTAWPVFTWRVPITSRVAGRICDLHGPDLAGSGVTVTSTDAVTPRAFHHAWRPATGEVTSRCDPRACAAEATCLNGVCRCDIGWVGDGLSCAPVGLFVTRATYPSGLGGLAGADATCQTIADGLDYPGRWAAVLSDSTRAARDRLTLRGPFFNTQGERVASTPADLWSGELAHAIRYDETGLPVVLADVWTGTDDDGSRDGAPESTLADDFCGDWMCPDRYRSVTFTYTGAACTQSAWPDPAARCVGDAGGVSPVTVTARSASGQLLFLGDVATGGSLALDPGALGTSFECELRVTLARPGGGATLQELTIPTGHTTSFAVGSRLGALTVASVVTQVDRRTGAEAGVSDATRGWLGRYGPSLGRFSCDGRAHLFCVAVQ